MTRENRIIGYLGLAARSGQIVFGESAVISSIRAGRAALVLLDVGAADNARKKLEDACGYRNVRLYLLPSDMIGRAVGKPGRMAACLPRGGLQQALEQLLPVSGFDPSHMNEQTITQTCGGASVE